jgi:hypothetical protein
MRNETGNYMSNKADGWDSRPYPAVDYVGRDQRTAGPVPSLCSLRSLWLISSSGNE